MSFKETMDAMDLLDDPKVDGSRVVESLSRCGLDKVIATRVEGENGYTDETPYDAVEVPGGFEH